MRAYLANVQVLRFLAAAMVLYAHLLNETADHGLPARTIADPTGIAWRTGVDIFFVISGFVMYYLSHDRFGDWRNGVDFLRRRFLRVAPMYWLFTGLMLVALVVVPDRILHGDLTPATMLGSLLFFPVVRADGDVYPILAVGWTLEYEIFFYVCFALALVVPRRIGLSLLLAGFVVLAAAWHFVDRSQVALKYFSDPIILEFLMGVLLAHLYLAGLRLNRWGQWGCVAAGFALMVILGRHQQLDRWILAGAPAFVVALGLVTGPEIKTRWPAVGGDASYALYLSHPFVLSSLALVWARTKLPADGWSFVAVGFVVCTGASLLVYRWLEVPLLRTLRRRFAPTRVVSGRGGVPPWFLQRRRR